MLDDPIGEAAPVTGSYIRILERLGVAPDGRERRLQLVRGVRHELGAHPIEPPQLRQVGEYRHHPARRQPPRRHQHGSAKHVELGLRALVGYGRRREERDEPRFAEQRAYRPARQRLPRAQDRAQLRIHPHHATAAVQGEHAFTHLA